jgi:4-amino-4-deoxy-L-arabinose transferase-like glycosyltransferase
MPLRKWLPLVIFLLALAARLLAVVVVDVATDMPQTGFSRSASSEFARLAENMLAGRGFSYFMIQGQWVPSGRMPPLYPLILAGVFMVLGKTPAAFVVVQLAQAVLGAVTAVLVYWIARRLLGPSTGLLTGLIYACGYPVLLYSVVEVHTVSLYVLLNCLTVYLLLRLTESPEQALRPAWAWLAGAVMALVALSTAEALIYISLLIAWLFLACPPRRALRIALPFGLAAVLVLTPWTIRNYVAFGRLVPLRVQAGFILWRGQNEFTTGSGYAPVPGGLVWSTPEIATQIIALPPSQDWEARVDEIYMAEALTFMREHPWRSLTLVPNKLFYYWVGDFQHPLSRNPFYWLPWMVYGPLFALGFVLSLGLRSKPWILYAYIGMGSVLISVFNVLPRYRLFIEPFIVAFVSYGIWRTLKFLSARGMLLTSAVLRILGSLAGDV